jgi:hypothetical protein
MDGPLYLDTGPLLHFITYLFLICLPMVVTFCCHSAISKDPASCRFLIATILWGTPWPPHGHRGAIFLGRSKIQMKVRNRHCQMTTRQKSRPHIFALTIVSLKVGCCVELFLQGLRHPHYARLIALQGIQGNPRSNQVHFNSDPFPIGVDNHTSYCMVNSPHLLENLILSDMGKVDGINEGLEILGKGTFKFTITDDNGWLHNAHISNSLYLPGLEEYLLSSQHWVQDKARENKKWMGNFAHCCILHW